MFVFQICIDILKFDDGFFYSITRLSLFYTSYSRESKNSHDILMHIGRFRDIQIKKTKTCVKQWNLKVNGKMSFIFMKIWIFIITLQIIVKIIVVIYLNHDRNWPPNSSYSNFNNLLELALYQIKKKKDLMFAAHNFCCKCCNVCETIHISYDILM